VLVVDDDPADAILARRGLRHRERGDSFEVLHASTLAQGIDRLRHEPVDALLLDLHLPDSDGVDTVVRLRRRVPHVPLVVFTGVDDPELEARTFEAGADGYLVKDGLVPFDLRRTIYRAIERRRASVLPMPSDEEERALLRDLRDLHAVVRGVAESAPEAPDVQTRADALLRATRVAADLMERRPELEAEGAADGAVELSGLLRRAEPLLRAILPRDVELHLALAVDLPRVAAPVERVLCAVLELVANAVDAIGGARGQIELRTGRSLGADDSTGWLVRGGASEGPRVWLEVRDRRRCGHRRRRERLRAQRPRAAPLGARRRAARREPAGRRRPLPHPVPPERVTQGGIGARRACATISRW
jgi:DNA-binding response OmpR family regulator